VHDGSDNDNNEVGFGEEDSNTDHSKETSYDNKEDKEDEDGLELNVSFALPDDDDDDVQVFIFQRAETFVS